MGPRSKSAHAASKRWPEARIRSLMKPIILSVFALFLLSPAAFAQPTVYLKVIVLDQASKISSREIPVPGAGITLTAENGKTYSARTDGGGGYSTYTLPEGWYKISITANGYEPYSTPDFDNIGPNEIVYLAKVGERRRDESEEAIQWRDRAVAPRGTWAISPPLSSKVLSPDEEQEAIDRLLGVMAGALERGRQKKAIEWLEYDISYDDKLLVDRLLKARIAQRTIRIWIEETEKEKLGKPTPGFSLKDLDPEVDRFAIYARWYDDLKWVVESSQDPEMTPEIRTRLRAEFQKNVKKPEKLKQDFSEPGYSNLLADRYLMGDVWGDKTVERMGYARPCSVKMCNVRYMVFPTYFIDGKMEKVPGLFQETYFDTAAESDLPSWVDTGELFGLGWRQLAVKLPEWKDAYFPEMYRTAPFCPSRIVGRFGYPNGCPAAQAQNVPKDAPPEFTCERKEGKGNCQQLPGAPFLWLAKTCAPGYSYFTWQVPPKKGTFRVPVCAKAQNLTSFPGLSDLRPFPPERL